MRIIGPTESIVAFALTFTVNREPECLRFPVKRAELPCEWRFWIFDFTLTCGTQSFISQIMVGDW
jgi:hypothetical protein